MTLRIKLVLITTAVVTILFGVSEWWSYQHTAALLDKHEAILKETADHSVALERLKATRDSLFVSVTTVRVLHAIITLLVAVAILNLVWYRVIYRPIQRLLANINSMGRGTWKLSVPVKRNDEIGELTRAFNDLGGQLDATFRSINASSKLAALALIGNRMIRTVTSVRSQIGTCRKSLERPGSGGIEAGVEILTRVELQLAELELRFEKDFNEELAAVSGEPASAGTSA